jgi:hypothetical protein
VQLEPVSVVTLLAVVVELATILELRELVELVAVVLVHLAVLQPLGLEPQTLAAAVVVVGLMLALQAPADQAL